MSGFNFGQPASTGASASSPFGTSSNTTPSSGGLFGGAGVTGGSSTGFSFGGNTTASKPSTAPPLFGAAASATGAGSGESTSIFGKALGNTSNVFSFGNKTEENKSTEQTKPSIFTSNASQPPATPASTAPLLFGATTPASSSGPSLTFGNLSTTPAGPPPQASTFGASTGTGGLFGSASNQASQDTSKKPTFSLGKPATSAPAVGTEAAKSQSTPSLLGSTQQSSGGLFGAKSADQANSAAQQTNTPAPAGSGFSFGNTAVSTTKDNPAPPLFGALPTTGASASTTAAQSTPSLFGTAQPTTTNLFGKPATGAQSSTNLFSQPPNPSTETASKPSFSFPAVTGQSTSSSSQSAPTTTAAAEKPLFSAPASSTLAPSGGLFSLGQKPSQSSLNATTASSSGTIPAFSLGGTTVTPASTGAGATATTAATTAPPASKPTATTGLTTTTLGASTSGPVPPAQSRLRNKTLDEILTRWATDLTRYTKDFKTQAETIAHWDQIIVDNSSKIDKLYVKTRTCEKQTMSVEMQLAAVENQQNELDSWLSKYETDVEEMLAKEGSGQTELGGPDQERERTYKLAEKLGERLEDMGRDLESMVEQVNAANASLSKHTKSDEPITQIVRILNSHLTQLQQIDQGTTALQAKVSAAQKTANHLGYLNGNTTSEGRAAVDDFYKSYIGRR